MIFPNPKLILLISVIVPLHVISHFIKQSHPCSVYCIFRSQSEQARQKLAFLSSDVILTIDVAAVGDSKRSNEP